VSEFDIPAHLDPRTLVSRTSSVVEFAFAVDKRETGGKYGKPANYWDEFQAAIKAGEAKSIMRKKSSGGESPAWEIKTTVYRIPNEGIFDQINTIDKMAQKRAMVAAVLIGVNASEFFTQDLEDLQTVDYPVIIEHQPTTSVESKPTQLAPAATVTPPASELDGFFPRGEQPAVEQPKPADKPAKPFRFASTLAENFFKEVEAATGNYYQNGYHFEQSMKKIALTWSFLNDDEKRQQALSAMCDYASNRRAEGN